MRHSMSKDTAFNGETTPRHTFLFSDLQCLPPGDPRILCAKHGYPITGKSFIVSQNKLMLFYFMLCYLISLQYREFQERSRSHNIKSRTRLLKQSQKFGNNMVNYIFQSSHLYQRKQETSARKLPGCFDVCYLSRKSSSLLCELDSVQIRLSSKCGCALGVFVPTSFFQHR